MVWSEKSWVVTCTQRWTNQLPTRVGGPGLGRDEADAICHLCNRMESEKQNFHSSYRKMEFHTVHVEDIVRQGNEDVSNSEDGRSNQDFRSPYRNREFHTDHMEDERNEGVSTSVRSYINYMSGFTNSTRTVPRMVSIHPLIEGTRSRSGVAGQYPTTLSNPAQWLNMIPQRRYDTQAFHNRTVHFREEDQTTSWNASSTHWLWSTVVFQQWLLARAQQEELRADTESFREEVD